MFICPLIDLVFLEDYFGINLLFENRTKSKIELCPNCYSESIKRIYLADDCDDIYNKLFCLESKNFD